MASGPPAAHGFAGVCLEWPSFARNGQAFPPLAGLVPLHFRVSGKLAKRGLPNREPFVFKAFMSAEYFANPRKLGKVLKLSSFP